MPKQAHAIAIAASRQDNPFAALAESMHNALNGIFDFMYGTKERSRITNIFGFGMMVLGLLMSNMDTPEILMGCTA